MIDLLILAGFFYQFGIFFGCCVDVCALSALSSSDRASSLNYCGVFCGIFCVGITAGQPHPQPGLPLSVPRGGQPGGAAIVRPIMEHPTKCGRLLTMDGCNIMSYTIWAADITVFVLLKLGFFRVKIFGNWEPGNY